MKETIINSKKGIDGYGSLDSLRMTQVEKHV